MTIGNTDVRSVPDNMNLENQVVSLELAKKLKELGVKQKSLFWWWYSGKWWRVTLSENNRPDPQYSAFTVAELGELLPSGFSSMPFKTAEGEVGWLANYKSDELIAGYFAEREADARAELLARLIEKGVVKV